MSASARLLDAVFRERPVTLEGAVRLSKFLGVLSYATTQYRFLRGDATSMVMLAGIVQLLFAVLGALGSGRHVPDVRRRVARSHASLLGYRHIDSGWLER